MDQDRALMRRVRNGDEQAFTTLVERHTGRMIAVAARLLGSRADAEDAVQQAFLQCYTQAPSYRSEWAVSTWLYRILTNACLDAIRRRGARPEVRERAARDGHVAGERGGDARHEPADAARRHDLVIADRIDIDRLLERVPTEARVLLVLRYVDGLSYGELARVRGITVNTVKSQLSRGKAILRAALSKETR